MDRYAPTSNTRIFGEGWRLEPDDADSVITFTKPQIKFNTSPPIRRVENYLESGLQNEAYRKSIELPDAVLDIPSVKRAFENGWIIGNPGEFEVSVVSDGYGELQLQMDKDHVAPSKLNNWPRENMPSDVVQLRTEWTIELDPNTPYLITHPVFADHEDFTVIPYVLHPNEFSGDLVVYLRIRKLPNWFKYDSPIAQLTPLPSEIHEGFESLIQSA